MLRLRLAALTILSITALLPSISESAVVNVNCAKTKVSGVISKSKMTEPLVLNVTGTCIDNVEIPKGYNVTINGNTGATISPAKDNTPALRIRGALYVNGTTITSTRKTRELVLVQDGGYLSLSRSVVRSTTSFQLILGRLASLAISDTQLDGGTDAALLLSNSSATVDVGSGYFSIKSSGSAIWCENSALDVNAENGSSLTIGPAGEGIAGRGCSAKVGGWKANRNITITGNQWRAVGAVLGSSILLQHVNISSNEGAAVQSQASSVELRDVSISGHNTGLLAMRGGVIFFSQSDFGPSRVNADPSYQCYQNGRIYADEGVILNAIEIDGCLTIGGDYIE